MDVREDRDLHLLLWDEGEDIFMLTAIIACWRWMHYIVGIPTVWELNDGEHDGK